MRVHGLGKVIKIFKSLKPKKSMCEACYCDFYNGHGGNTKECWHFKKAQVALMTFYRSLNSCDYDVKTKALTCYQGTN